MSLTKFDNVEEKQYALGISTKMGHEAFNVLTDNIPAVEDAIKKAGGWITKAASLLGCSPGHLSRIIAKTPELLEVYQDIKEKYNDIAEINLVKLVREKNLDAIKYWLNNQAKNRGWGIKEEDNNKGNTIIFNVEPAFSMEDVQKQAENRIKEIEVKEYIETQIKEIKSEEKSQGDEKIDKLIEEVSTNAKNNEITKKVFEKEEIWDK